MGCGTGIASRLMARRGARCSGGSRSKNGGDRCVHGIDVEIGAFEDWNPAGRSFDRVISAQAWHGSTCASPPPRPLRVCGRRAPCLIWSAGFPPDDFADALDEVYGTCCRAACTESSGVTQPTGQLTRGADWTELAAIAAAPDFGVPTEQWFPWTKTYERDHWLEQLLSRSDHTALDPPVRDLLFEAIGAAIDDVGGSFVMNFETVLITAIRLASVIESPTTTSPYRVGQRPAARCNTRSTASPKCRGDFVPEPAFGDTRRANP